jgi:hypothetical protein
MPLFIKWIFMAIRTANPKTRARSTTQRGQLAALPAAMGEGQGVSIVGVPVVRTSATATWSVAVCRPPEFAPPPAGRAVPCGLDFAETPPTRGPT